MRWHTVDTDFTDDIYSAGFVIRAAFGIGAGVLVVLLIDRVYTVPESLLSWGAIAVVGGFVSGGLTTATLLPGVGFGRKEALTDRAVVLSGVSQFLVFFIGTLTAPGYSNTTGPVVIVITAVMAGLILGVVGSVGGFAGCQFMLSTVPPDSAIFDEHKEILPDRRALPTTLSVGALSRLPMVCYLPIAIVILGGEWIFEALGRSPIENEYLTMRVDTTALFDVRLREDVPETAEFTASLDFGGYQPAFDFLDPIVTSFLLPSDLFDLLLSVFGSTIIDTIHVVVIYVLYLVGVIGILEFLLPVAIVVSVLMMVPSYESGLPIWAFVGNAVLVVAVVVILLLIGPMPLLGVGITYEIGPLGQLHLLALAVHAVTGFVTLSFVDSTE